MLKTSHFCSSSSTLSGNRAHPTKNSAGRDDGNHVIVYQSKDFTRSNIALTQGGLILIAILSGGDYHQAGLPRCGPSIAHGLAKCGFGDRLLEAARSMPRHGLEEFLVTWRQELCDELRTNSSGHIGRKNPALAKSVTEDFPDIDVLLSYTNPITSESEGKAHKIKFIWDRPLDLGRIAHICELYFEWGVRSVIIKRFRSVIWPAAVLRLLREKILMQDAQESRRISPSPPLNGDRAVTVADPPPSSVPAHISSVHLLDDLDRKVIQKIHSTRMHASTDGLLEYRLEISPRSIVSSAEVGIKDIRPPLIDDLNDSDDTEELEESQGTAKSSSDPNSNFRVWIPACMVALAEPALVDEYDESQKRKQEKTSKKTKKESTRAANEVIAVPKIKHLHQASQDSNAVRSSGPEKSRGPHLKGFFGVSKQTAQVGGSKLTKVLEKNLSIPTSTGESSTLEALKKPNTLAQTKASSSKPTLAPRPFPISLDSNSDSEDAPVESPILTGGREGRSPPSASDTEKISLDKSPRKSVSHTSPRSAATQAALRPRPSSRIPSPSPTGSRVLPLRKDPSIINISSDEEDNPTSILKTSAAPLLIAKARARTEANKSRVNNAEEIIDLT
jgi:Holliday junction resolvase YEN1